MILFAGISTLSFGQGVTSANIAGLITDKSGEPLIGAKEFKEECEQVCV